MKVDVLNLSKIIYDADDQEVVLFNNLNFSLVENDINLMYGSNGSGKTTLALMLAGFLKPTGGEIKIGDTVFNNKTNKKTLKIFKKDTRILFQDSNLQIFKTTIEEEIKFALVNYFKKDYKNKVEFANFVEETIKIVFKYLNFDSSYRQKSPHNLSAGEKRKLLISCLLVTKPKFLILDEPTIGLDNKTKKIFLEYLKDLNNHFECTILLITHDKDIIEFYENIINIDNLKIH